MTTRLEEGTLSPSPASLKDELASPLLSSLAVLQLCSAVEPLYH